MGGCIDTILMLVKFGDDPISSLDFSFIGGGGVPVSELSFVMPQEESSILPRFFPQFFVSIGNGNTDTWFLIRKLGVECLEPYFNISK